MLTTRSTIFAVEPETFSNSFKGPRSCCRLDYQIECGKFAKFLRDVIRISPAKFPIKRPSHWIEPLSFQIWCIPSRCRVRQRPNSGVDLIRLGCGCRWRNNRGGVVFVQRCQFARQLPFYTVLRSWRSFFIYRFPSSAMLNDASRFILEKDTVMVGETLTRNNRLTALNAKFNLIDAKIFVCPIL